MTVTSRYRRATTITFDGDAITVALRHITSPTRISLIRSQLGLTDARALIEGRLVDPLELPAAIKAGATAALTWAGRSGLARLEPYEDALPDALRRRFGQRILLTWDTDEVPR